MGRPEGGDRLWAGWYQGIAEAEGGGVADTNGEAPLYPAGRWHGCESSDQPLLDNVFVSPASEPSVRNQLLKSSKTSSSDRCFVRSDW